MWQAAVVFLLLASTSVAATPPCDVSGGDAAAVATARATVEAACDCSTAPSRASWQRCVRETLTPLIGSSVSTSCARVVRRTESRSTCGTDKEVCCRTDRRGTTRGALRTADRCTHPAGGSSCISPFDYLDDGCTADGCAQLPATCGNGNVESGEACDPPDGIACSATCQICLPDGCIAPSSCGDGHIDSGESCDPPNGTTCSSSCTSCAPPGPGEILVGCTSGATSVDAAAVASTLLVAYTETTPGGLDHSVAKRLSNDGSLMDPMPLGVSGLLPNSAAAVGGFTQAATSDEVDFYVGWSTSAYVFSYFAGRRVPVSGPLSSGPDTIVENFLLGQCRDGLGAPLNLAPQLGGGSFLPTWRVLYLCPDLFFETIAGVGNFFSVPPPGNLSSGPAPIVRGQNDIAAIWWNEHVSSLQPPVVEHFLAASFVAPRVPEMLLLSHGASPEAPALALTAIGDTFVAVWANANEVRALRFNRTSGPNGTPGTLDPDGGVLVATAGSAVGDIAVASNGTSVIIAWREDTGPAESTIRAIRVGPDGTALDPAPILVATSTPTAEVAIAANAAASLVAYTREEITGHSIRAVRLNP